MSIDPTIFKLDSLPLWQIRVLEEHGELVDRIAKLRSFIDSVAFGQIVTASEQALLREQLMHMDGYRAVLAARINGWLK